MQCCVVFMSRLFVVAACTCTTVHAETLSTSANEPNVSNTVRVSRNQPSLTSSLGHLSTVGHTTFGTNRTKTGVKDVSIKVKMIGAGTIAFFSFILLLTVPLFCYTMKRHRTNWLSAETTSTRPSGVHDETHTNDQRVDDITIASVVELTDYTPLGITDAYLNRAVAFTMRDRIALHNLSRQLQIIIDKMEVHPDGDVVRVKAIQEGYTDDEERVYGASGQSTNVKTLTETPTDQFRRTPTTNDSHASLTFHCEPSRTAENGLFHTETKHRERLPLPRFDETSSNFYYDISGLSRFRPMNGSCEYLEPIRVASTPQPSISNSTDASSLGLPHSPAAIKDDAFLILKDAED